MSVVWPSICDTIKHVHTHTGKKPFLRSMWTNLCVHRHCAKRHASSTCNSTKYFISGWKLESKILIYIGILPKLLILYKFWLCHNHDNQFTMALTCVYRFASVPARSHCCVMCHSAKAHFNSHRRAEINVILGQGNSSSRIRCSIICRFSQHLTGHRTMHNKCLSLWIPELSFTFFCWRYYSVKMINGNWR